MNVESSVPQVLVQNQAFDEAQDTSLTTIRLEPNSTSQVTSTFVIPKAGSVVDSNSSLVWSVSWDGYNAARNNNDQLVCLKQFSGCLNTLQRARLYVGGRLLFNNPDVGLTAHIHKLSTNPDHFEQVEDCKLGSQHGYYASSNGQIKVGQDESNQTAQANQRLSRQLGSYSTTPANNSSWEGTILLSEMFPALKHLQIPIKHLKEEMRIEIDWNTNFDEVATIVRDTANAITDTSISVQNPLLFLDYLTYNEEVEMGLQMASQQGMTIPYREISLIQKQLPAIAAGENSQDVLLGFQGKLLMKVYVSHKFSNVINAATIAPQLLNGRCRCDRGQNFKYNLVVNDLHIHDSKVDTSSQTYSYMSMTAQNPVYVFPNTYDFNSAFGNAVAAADINSGEIIVAGQTHNAANNGLSDVQCRDGISGTQAWIGFDLSRYGVEGGLNPQNSGYRVGSTPMVLNITQEGGGANTRQNSVKQVDVICESVKILQIRNGMVDVVDA